MRTIKVTKRPLTNTYTVEVYDALDNRLATRDSLQGESVAEAIYNTIKAFPNACGITIED